MKGDTRSLGFSSRDDDRILILAGWNYLVTWLGCPYGEQ